MRLDEIQLTNIGVYKGTQTVDLRTTKDKPVVLIGGLNGCGKTTLLDSMHLCLYGSRGQCAGRGDLKYEEYLRELINRKAKHDTASIQMRFNIAIDGKDREYRLVRSWSAHGSGVRESVQVFTDGKLSPVLSESWADHVEDLIPRELSSLFLFDGEKVKNLADPKTATTVIRSAINSLLGVKSLEQLRTDLLALKRRQQSPDDDPEITGQVDGLLARMKQLEEQKDSLLMRRAALTSELQTAQNALAAATEAFQAEGGELFEVQETLRAKRQRLDDELARSDDELLSLAEGALPLALLDHVTPRLREAVARQQLNAEAVAISSVLQDRDTWILGLLDATAAKQIEAALAQDRESRRPAAANDERHYPSGLLPRLDSLATVLQQERARAKRACEDHESIKSQLDELDALLASVPADDRIEELKARRDSEQNRAIQIQGKIDLTDEYLASLRAEIERTAHDLALAEARRRETLNEQDYVRRVIDNIDRARDTLDDLRKQQIMKHVGKIEVATLDSFRKLMRKQGLIADLRIDPETFDLTLIGADGETVRTGGLSAGENQLLAISLLWGLARVAGRPMPTVVDTPLGRLDSHNRRLLVERYFPEAAEQVLLLSTDEEFDKELHALLEPKIARSYLLEHDEETQTTAIADGYWWQDERPANDH